MNSDCLFCKIVAGTIPAKRVYEDDLCLCFADIHPQAPTHLLLISKRHNSPRSPNAEPTDSPLLGHLLAKAADDRTRRGVAMATAWSSTPARTAARRSNHLHLHLLGGRHMGWPPG